MEGMPMIDCREHRGTRAAVCAAVVIAVASLLAGCATPFSPALIRGEIARQTGQDPQGVFEMSLGRPTMALAKSVLGASTGGGSLPLAGVAAFEMASYEIPAGAVGIDFTRMPIRGWEPFLKFREGSKSALVLIRPEGETVGDLVLVAGEAGRVLYARIQGRLSRELPEALGRTVRSDGPEAVRRELLSIVEEPD
jgi:hypothetical protein